MRKTRLLLIVFFLLAVILTGCTEETVEWTPIRAASQTEAAPQSFAQTEAPSTLPTAPTVQREIRLQTEETEAASDPVEASEEAISASSETGTDAACGPKETNTPEETLDRTLPEQTDAPALENSTEEPQVAYIANTNTKKFHYPDCSSVKDMKESNKLYFTGTRDELIEQGYQPCKRCNP